jgi:hypothetical protein
MDPASLRAARVWADTYRGFDFQPLPSDPRAAADGGRKKPLCKYAQWWESYAPAGLFDRFPTTNIQVMTGRAWGLAVLDLDGQGGKDHVANHWGKLPRTWTVESGGGGRHLWYRLPPGLPAKGRVRLWGEWDSGADGGKGSWAHHTGIELLCDRCLIMAPPSVHPETRRPYRFLAGLSPFEIAVPAMLPAWVWGMAEIKPPPRPKSDAPPAPPRRDLPPGMRADRNSVLDAIPDKADVARGWGLRFAERAMESSGWVAVHDAGREDINPSARFCPATGSYWTPNSGKPVSLFDLGVALGHFADWMSCRDDLAARYLT